MTLHQQLGRMIDYHLWAQERALGSMETMAEAAPTDAMTLFGHIVQADWVWHRRLAGESPSVALFDEFTDVSACRAAFEESASIWRSYQTNLHQVNLGERVQYRNVKGDAFGNSILDILTHVLNHGTYHRGQIARSVRQAGGTPAVTDYISFARERG